MNRILAVDPENLIAMVAARRGARGACSRRSRRTGCSTRRIPTRRQLHRWAATSRRTPAAPRRSSTASPATTCSGLEWVLPERRACCARAGAPSRASPATISSALLVGSEGTLGVATEITVQLIPRPRGVMTALLPFRDRARRGARGERRAAAPARCRGASSCSTTWRSTAVRGKGYSASPTGAGPCVIAEVDGSPTTRVLAELQAVADVARPPRRPRDVLGASDRDQRARALGSAAQARLAGARALKAPSCPRTSSCRARASPEAIARFKAVGARLGLTVATYGHAGDGNLHANVLWDSPAQRPAVDQALAEIMAITVELQGTITGEHGVGLAKRGVPGARAVPAHHRFSTKPEVLL